VDGDSDEELVAAGGAAASDTGGVPHHLLDRGSDRDFVAQGRGLRLLYRSVGRNVLFRACAEEELRDLVTAFDEAQMTDRATRSSASRWGRSTPAPPPAS